MSKLSEALRARGVYNDHELLLRFGGPKDVSVNYRPAEARLCGASRASVYSPRFSTNPKAHWSDYGKKSFFGKRAESMPEALAWASEQYGITEWAPSPFGGAKLPASVVRKAKAFIAENAQ